MPGYGLAFVLVGASPGGHGLSLVDVLRQLVLLFMVSRREHAGTRNVGDRVPAATAQDDGAADGDRRVDQRAGDVHSVGGPVATDQRRPNDRAGFIEVPLTGAAHRPARAM